MRNATNSFRPAHLLSLLLAALLATLTPIGLASAQHASIPSKIQLYGGQVQVFRSDRPLARVAVGNGALIEVTTIERRQVVMIAGATSGMTTMHLWYEDGSQRTIEVIVAGTYRPDTADAVREMLGPNAKVRVNEVGGNIVLTGELSALEAERINVIKQVYPNLVDLTSADPVDMKPMVLMDVRIMEFNKNALRDLGVRWDAVIAGPSGGYLKDIATNPYYRILPEGSPFGSLDLPARVNPAASYFGIATSITSQIDILATSGQAWELAAPQLSARSGGTANFLVGGRLPIPISSGFGQTSIQFEDYGIQLEITPLVNENNQVMANIRTEVSKIDPTVSVLGVPGFLTRETETEINVQAGDTIVISGLVDITGSKALQGIPGLSRLPLLGRLFRSDQFRAGRTDLVVFVTPRVVTAGSPANLENIERSDRMLRDFRNTIGTDIFD